MAELRVELNLQDVFTLASLQRTTVQNCSISLTCVYYENSSLFEETLTTAALFQFSFIYVVTFALCSLILFVRSDTFVKCFLQSHVGFFFKLIINHKSSSFHFY